MTKSRVTIGIKALNEERHIAASIESALEAARSVDGSVLLADSGSTDRTLDIARAYPIKIVQLTNPEERCCGAGAQLAFQNADCDFFYLLDGDMEIEPAFLPAALNLLEEHPKLAGVGGQIEEMNVAGQDFEIRSAKARVRPPGAFYEVDRLDCGGLYRAVAIRESGYFADKNLHAFEEFELAARLAARGWWFARLNTRAIRHHGHSENGYRLLWRRWRSGYAGAAGEVLRGAIGQPHFSYVIARLSHLKFGVAVVTWWALLTLAAIAPVSAMARLALLSILLILPVALLTMRRRSLRLGLYSLVAWNVSALGTLAGLTRTRRPATQALASTILQNNSVIRNLAANPQPPEAACRVVTLGETT